MMGCGPTWRGETKRVFVYHVRWKKVIKWVSTEIYDESVRTKELRNHTLNVRIENKWLLSFMHLASSSEKNIFLLLLGCNEFVIISVFNHHNSLYSVFSHSLLQKYCLSTLSALVSLMLYFVQILGQIRYTPAGGFFWSNNYWCWSLSCALVIIKANTEHNNGN